MPYEPSLPFGSSPSGPVKHTYWRSAVTSVTPHCLRSTCSGTPVHSELDRPAAPQLKPMVCLRMFCSLRRLPAHTTSTGVVMDFMRASWSMDRESFLSTKPPTVTLCVSQSSLGTAPWLRTRCSGAGVIGPAFIRSVRWGSTLNGWMPVRRIRSLCLGTHASGVLASFGSTSSASCSISARRSPPQRNSSFRNWVSSMGTVTLLARFASELWSPRRASMARFTAATAKTPCPSIVGTFLPRPGAGSVDARETSATRDMLREGERGVVRKF